MRTVKTAQQNIRRKVVSGKARVARHDVRDEIQRRILSGESKPGERLSQQNLARELGVAQGTVRESLLELQFLGLVDSVDHLGVFVDNLDAARICEGYMVREIMEGLAARLACNHASRADIAELPRDGRLHIRVSKKAGNKTASLDRSFHLHITELSNNRTLIRLSQTYRVLGMTVRAFRDPSIIQKEHLAIVEAIEKNQADEAERLARLHVTGAREMIETQVAEGKFVPKWVE